MNNKHFNLGQVVSHYGHLCRVYGPAQSDWLDIIDWTGETTSVPPQSLDTVSDDIAEKYLALVKKAEFLKTTLTTLETKMRNQS